MTTATKEAQETSGKFTPTLIDTRPFTDEQVFDALQLLVNVCEYYQDANTKLGNHNKCEGCPLRDVYDNECAIENQYASNGADTLCDWCFEKPGAPYKAFT